MPFLCGPLDLRYLDGRKWEVRSALVYSTLDKATVEVQPGFLTDFASVPRAFWGWLPPTGQYGKAAIVHDYLYATHLALVLGGVPTAIDREWADGVFLSAMKELGVSVARRRLMWSAVRAFGDRPWREGPRRWDGEGDACR